MSLCVTTFVGPCNSLQESEKFPCWNCSLLFFKFPPKFSNIEWASIYINSHDKNWNNIFTYLKTMLFWNCSQATLARKIFRSETFLKPCYRMSLFLIGFFGKTTWRTYNFQLKSQNSLVLLWFTFKKEGWNLACFCSAISKI